MGYFETRRDRARYATYRWLLRQQMWRHRTMPNPNPAQPEHEPVLQHVDPPDLYDYGVYTTDADGKVWHSPTTAGAAAQLVDGFGNAIRTAEHNAALEAEGRVPGDEWHVCESKAAEIREEQNTAHNERHLKHGMDIANSDGGDSGYTVAPESMQGDSTGVVQMPVKYNDTDDAWVGHDADPTEFVPGPDAIDDVPVKVGEYHDNAYPLISLDADPKEEPHDES